MGVTGLWTVLQPCARPIKIETLNRKRLAVDASIWIYQFLKAVRDKEGNALRNSHVVGFFRRICKLLFFGIKPVFVFDGGAPALKRQTINNRKARREGRREDAVKTAGKLLAVQMQRRAEEEDLKRREEKDRVNNARYDDDEEEIPEDLVYVDELQMTERERRQNRTFKKKDAYHLPDLDVSLHEMGAPNDPRIMSQAELEEYARQFHTGEDINIYDFSKIDFNGPFFLSLPASDRYNILNAARLRSRLRMGYSKEQLDTMFPDRMAFSRFQVERVKERNELTQRLMNINGMNGEAAMLGIDGVGRVAGEKGREYVLVKNDGVEGGWALGVVSNKQEGERNKPIDVDKIKNEVIIDDEDGSSDEDVEFEDVPIEGLNRLPKRTTRDVIEKRKAFYRKRRETHGVFGRSRNEAVDRDPQSLFFPMESTNDMSSSEDEAEEGLFEDVRPQEAEEDEDEELQRAINMSLQDPEEEKSATNEAALTAAILNGPPTDQPLQFNQQNASAGRAFAHLANSRAALDSIPRPFREDSAGRDDDDDNVSLQAALAGSAFMTAKLGNQRDSEVLSQPSRPVSIVTSGFDGPLPFESLKLGKSILTKKKKKPVLEEEGGFEKDSEADKPAKVVPPWFSGDIRKDYSAQRIIEKQQTATADQQDQPKSQDYGFKVPVLERHETGEVIDLEMPKPSQNEVIDIGSSGEEDDDLIMTDVLPVQRSAHIEDVTILNRAESPQYSLPSKRIAETTTPMEATEIKVTQVVELRKGDSVSDVSGEVSIEWEASDQEQDVHKSIYGTDVAELGGRASQIPQGSPTPEFEDVVLPGSPTKAGEADRIGTSSPRRVENNEAAEDVVIPDASFVPNDQDDYSDPEDDELMRQLAVEAEEHARFASTLNVNSKIRSGEDYERELRQLRSQQKKDRRDADEVTQIMITECQQLLKLFGLPYITAPMEAEAQCAELIRLGLVDGIVTDDSDIFLFGGTRVYKNMFNQAKFVECYLSSDLEKEYSLSREKIIQIAHLLGSDYTEGLPSIGPVTALEILSEFPDLDAFKDWWSKVQTGRKLPEDTKSPFRKKFSRNAAKLFLPPTFPDKRVDYAYLHPEVDSDPSPFAWGVPDLDALRAYLMVTIGWSQERADEILVPVIKDMNRRENEGTQANITQFFSGAVGAGARDTGGKEGFAPRRREGKSRRMESALGKLHARAKERTIGEGEGEEVEEEDGESVAPDKEVGTKEGGRINGPPKKPRARKRAAPARSAGSDSGEDDDEFEAPRETAKRKKGAAKTKRS